MSFEALVVEEKDGKPAVAFKHIEDNALPPGDVLIAVSYSSLNYKDALAVTGKAPIIRYYPMVPGIDLAGTVEKSSSREFKKGDAVLVTGCGIGEEHWGGYSGKARVKAEWVIPIPHRLDPKRAMAVGTAGFTAMLCVMALEDHGIKPGQGEVLVTGAAGGVGSVAVALLAGLGHSVTASTGRASAHPYLKKLGATRMIDRHALTRPSEKALEPARWRGAIDTVGGETLATVIRQLDYGCSVAACGLAGGHTLKATVYPFILRAVNLLGINSSACPRDRRRKAWERIAADLPRELLDEMTQVAPLRDVPKLSEEMLLGKLRGRTVINLKANG